MQTKEKKTTTLIEENTKTSFIIKNLFPILSISIILIGLIILYKAGNVEQYITDPMRIGFGYLISLSLLGGYFFDKIRKSFYSQILLSAVLSSLTITTIIGTNVYTVFSNTVGICIMALLFIVGLCIAYIHKSEIEFTTTAVIGALIPVLFHSNAFALFLSFEFGLFIALYIFLYFFENTKVFQHILYWSMYVTIFTLFITGLSFRYTKQANDIELIVLIFMVNISCIAPTLLLKWKLISEAYFTPIYLLQICTSTLITFALSNSIGIASKSVLFGKSVVAASILFLIMLIWLQQKYTKPATKQENLHIIIFCLCFLLTLYLPDMFLYKSMWTGICIALHLLILNQRFDKTRQQTWKTIITSLFYIFVTFNAFPLLIGIFTFILHIFFVDHTALHDKVITASLFIASLWCLYFFTDKKRAYALDSSQLLITSWVMTAIYFLYIPWQLTNIIFQGNGLLQLVLISILWLSAAFTTTLIALKNGRLGLRIFTIIVTSFLIIKLSFIDIPFFLESHMEFQLALYIIGFGLATLVLSRLLILEYTKNGSLLHEWNKFIDKIRAEKKQKIEQEAAKQALKVQQMRQTQQQQTITQNKVMSQPISPQSQQQSQLQADTSTNGVSQPNYKQQPLAHTINTQQQTAKPTTQQTAPAQSSFSQTHADYILNILTEQWELQNKTLKAQQQSLEEQKKILDHTLKMQQTLKVKIDYLGNELRNLK